MIFAIFYSYVSDDVDHRGDLFGFFPYYFYFFQNLPRIQGGKHCDEGFKLVRPKGARPLFICLSTLIDVKTYFKHFPIFLFFIFGPSACFF
jgi:hypothetical protein